MTAYMPEPSILRAAGRDWRTDSILTVVVGADALSPPPAWSSQYPWCAVEDGSSAVLEQLLERAEPIPHDAPLYVDRRLVGVARYGDAWKRTGRGGGYALVIYRHGAPIAAIATRTTDTGEPPSASVAVGPEGPEAWLPYVAAAAVACVETPEISDLHWLGKFVLYELAGLRPDLALTIHDIILRWWS